MAVFILLILTVALHFVIIETLIPYIQYGVYLGGNYDRKCKTRNHGKNHHP